MNPVSFSEHSSVYAEHQPEYNSLPAYKFPGSLEGRIACCWQLNWYERLYVLATGRIWHQILTFHSPLQPQLLTVEKPDMQQLGESVNG